MASRRGSKRGRSSTSKKQIEPHRQILNDLPKAKPEAYDAKDLVRALTDHCKTPIETRLSRSQLAKLKGDIPNPRSETQLGTFLEEWLRLFDHAFFFSQLSTRIRGIKVYSSNSNNSRGEYRPDTRMIHINFWLGQQYHPLGESYLCALVHEMVHGFLDIFVCACRKVCARKVRAVKGGEGRTGHGASWCNSTIAIQRAFQAEVDWVVDCGIEVGLLEELEKSPKWRPRPDQLARWGVALPGQSQYPEGKGEPGLSHGFWSASAVPNPDVDEYSLSSYSDSDKFWRSESRSDGDEETHTYEANPPSEEWVDDTVHSDDSEDFFRSSNDGESDFVSNPDDNNHTTGRWQQANHNPLENPQTKRNYDFEDEQEEFRSPQPEPRQRVPRSRPRPGPKTRDEEPPALSEPIPPRRDSRPRPRPAHESEARGPKSSKATKPSNPRKGTRRRKRRRHKKRIPRPAPEPVFCCVIC